MQHSNYPSHLDVIYPIVRESPKTLGYKGPGIWRSESPITRHALKVRRFDEVQPTFWTLATLVFLLLLIHWYRTTLLKAEKE
jgi:hypothetical protein